MKMYLLVVLCMVILSACGTGYQKRGESPSYYGGSYWECQKIEGSTWGYGGAPGCDTKPPRQR